MGSVLRPLSWNKVLLKSFCKRKCEPTGLPGVCSLSPLARTVEPYIEVRGPVIGLVTGYLEEFAEVRD